MLPQIRIEEYKYPLPDSRIAKYPLEERDASKLLIYKDGVVSEDIFRNLAGYLPEGAMMVFNDTKVVPARLFFKRPSGARIEIFCLQPILPEEYNQIFSSTEFCRWKCVIGNIKRWKGDTLEYLLPEDATADIDEFRAVNLTATLVERMEQVGIVEFRWDGGVPFSKVLEMCGKVPIPPYLNRNTEPIDLERYQTLYAHIRGSVAAPTAGLHFTERVLSDIDAKGVKRENVCLHVGAGTFLPVKTSLVNEHPMHREPIVVSIDLLRKLCEGQRVIAVGTTSVRTLESLYYVGVSCLEQGEPREVAQWAPYNREYGYSTKEALSAIILYLVKHNLTELKVGTRIIIVPGFKFRIVDMMVTNFHQPESTLILLVSAFVGGDWRTIYDYALKHDFRFLSYGDSSLLFRRNQ